MIAKYGHAITMRGELQRARDITEAVRVLGSRSTQPLVPSLGRAVSALDEAIETLTAEIGIPSAAEETFDEIDEDIAIV